MSDFVNVGHLDDFPVNRTKQVKVGEREICVANNNGNLSAFDDRCTHAEAQLSDCVLESGEVACPLHGARFDAATGAVKTLPATEPLLMHEIKTAGKDVLIKLNDI